MVFNKLDEEAIVSFQSRSFLIYMLKSEVKAAKEQLYLECINLLAKYRLHISSTEVSNQFVIPKSLTNYPLYILCITKLPIFSPWQYYKVDMKYANMHLILQCSLSHFMCSIYTRMYSLKQIKDNNWGALTKDSVLIKPICISSSSEELVEEDGYLLRNAEFIFIFLPATIDSALLTEVILRNSVVDWWYTGKFTRIG